MEIVAADPKASALSEAQVRALLAAPQIAQGGVLRASRRAYFTVGEMLEWAAAGDMSVVELTPRRLAAFGYWAMLGPPEAGAHPIAVEAPRRHPWQS